MLEVREITHESVDEHHAFPLSRVEVSDAPTPERGEARRERKRLRTPLTLTTGDDHGPEGTDGPGDVERNHSEGRASGSGRATPNP